MSWPFRWRRAKPSEPRRHHSIAIWYSRKNAAPEGAGAQLELHVNLWRLQKRSNGLDVNALDLGFLVTNSSMVHNVYLYVPFTLRPNDIGDLTYLLMDAEIARAIFTDDVHPETSAANCPTFPITIGTRKLTCYKLQVNKDLSLKEVNGIIDGTIVEFKQSVFDMVPGSGDRYIRFRIYLTGAGLKAFFNCYKPTDRNLLSGYEEVEVVDFRFNEIRNLPRAVMEEMNSAGAHRFAVQLIRYFVIRDMTEELNLSHGDLRKCRTLEPEVWTRYVDIKNVSSSLLRDAIIFNWRKDGKCSTEVDFNALARFARRKTNWWTIIIFVVSLLMIGVVAGLLTPPALASLQWLRSLTESPTTVTNTSASNSANSPTGQPQDASASKEQHVSSSAGAPLNRPPASHNK